MISLGKLHFSIIKKFSQLALHENSEEILKLDYGVKGHNIYSLSRADQYSNRKKSKKILQIKNQYFAVKNIPSVSCCLKCDQH